MARSRKSILWALVTIFFVALTYFGINIFRQSQYKAKIAQELKKLPKFQAKRLDGLAFQSENLPQQPVVVLLFHSECEHCQYEATNIAQQREKFEGVQILMISVEPLTKIRAFAQKYDMGFVTMLQLNAVQMTQIFGEVSIPSIFIYDRQHRLRKHYRGEVMAETILKFL
jgi:peroxiredoxin